MRGSEALAIRHISGRRRCAAVPHDVDRYTEPHYSAATLLQPRTLREGTTIKSGTLAVDQALLTSAAGAACPCVIQIGGPGIGDPHGALRASSSDPASDPGCPTGPPRLGPIAEGPCVSGREQEDPKPRSSAGRASARAGPRLHGGRTGRNPLLSV